MWMKLDTHGQALHKTFVSLLSCPYSYKHCQTPVRCHIHKHINHIGLLFCDRSPTLLFVVNVIASNKKIE